MVFVWPSSNGCWELKLWPFGPWKATLSSCDRLAQGPTSPRSRPVSLFSLVFTGHCQKGLSDDPFFFSHELGLQPKNILKEWCPCLKLVDVGETTNINQHQLTLTNINHQPTSSYGPKGPTSTSTTRNTGALSKMVGSNFTLPGWYTPCTLPKAAATVKKPLGILLRAS